MLMLDNNKLENVANVVHCKLKLPDAMPVVIPFSADTHAKFEVAQCIVAVFSDFTAYRLQHAINLTSDP